MSLPYIEPDKMKQIEEFSIMRVVEYLGFEVNRQNCIHCFLPGHQDKKPSLKITPKKNFWFCFPCQQGGGVIQFVMAKFGYTYLEAAHWIANTFGIYTGVKNSNIRLRPTHKPQVDEQDYPSKPIVEPDKEILNWIVENGRLCQDARRYLCEERKLLPGIIKEHRIFSISDGRKFVSKIIAHFGLERGLDSRILTKDRNGNIISALGFNVVVFPYYDSEGDISNLQSRSYVPCDKRYRYKFPKDLSVHMYNLNRIIDFPTSEPLYIAEGVPDCLAMICDGKNAIAIPGVGNFNTDDIDYLRRHRLLMCPDNDSAGSNLYLKLVNEYQLNIGLVPVPDGFGDYADYYKYKQENGPQQS